MNKEAIIKKLTSRKFIVSLITLIAGVVTMIIGHGREVTAIAGALMSIVPAVVYCIMEGIVDAASVKTITDAASGAADQLGYDKAADVIDQVGDIVEDLVSDDADDLTEGGEPPGIE